MRKLISLIASILICKCTVNAQYVDIPDSNFRKQLKVLYPTCFNSSGQIDTTCSSIVNATVLYIGNDYPVVSIAGLRYFKKLVSLTVESYYIDDIPELPATVQHFSCINMWRLTHLPALPGGLKFLDCGGSDLLTELPALPAGLKELHCATCDGLTSLPALPASLAYLDCQQCSRLTSLPPIPSSLTYLDCSRCNIQQNIPALPVGLKSLYCFFNDSLPGFINLPEGLLRLDCSNGAYLPKGILSGFPSLPNSLKYLNCTGNHITSFPSMPASLDTLYCGDNALTQLPLFPVSSILKLLDCKSNMIESIPNLPNSIVFLDCQKNKLQNLPALPGTASTILCNDNLLLTLPALPVSLKVLGCVNNLLESLPVLNTTSLTSFSCSNNLLTSLPALPGALEYLFCDNNKLTTLPALPGGLKKLTCTNNKLTKLPALPNSLTELYCQKNQLTELPDIPNLFYYLDCSFNNIYCLPKLPPVIQWLYFDDKIKCTPNLPSTESFFGFNVVDSLGNTKVYWKPQFPICNPTNNTAGCHSFPVIEGFMFYDINSNGIKDAGEPAAVNKKLVLSDGNFTFSDKNGYYILTADAGNYTIEPVAPIYYNAVPALYNFNFTTYDTTVTANFPLQVKTLVDSFSISIYPARARPGFNFYYQLFYENTGTTALSPAIVLNYDTIRLEYISGPGTMIKNGNSLSLAESNMLPFQQKSFSVFFKLKTTAALGDTLFSNAMIHAGTFIDTVSNFTFIRGSYDPNDKQAIQHLTPAEVAAGTYIDYTIRFQNTGTDTAFNVVISDSLSSYLQLNSLELIGASHTCRFSIKGNKIYFEFRDILLPDSNVNEPASHGFVSFRIKPISALTNAVIPNKANIYFDYNAPVITNTANTVINNLPAVYTFTGKGNWNQSANWLNNQMPDNTIPDWVTIVIDPATGESCVLNVPVTFSKNAKLIVKEGRNFIITGKLTIK